MQRVLAARRLGQRRQRHGLAPRQRPQQGHGTHGCDPHLDVTGSRAGGTTSGKAFFTLEIARCARPKGLKASSAVGVFNSSGVFGKSTTDFTPSFTASRQRC